MINGLFGHHLPVTGAETACFTPFAGTAQNGPKLVLTRLSDNCCSSVAVPAESLLSQVVHNLSATILLAAGFGTSKTLSKLALACRLLKWCHFLGPNLSGIAQIDAFLTKAGIIDSTLSSKTPKECRGTPQSVIVFHRSGVFPGPECSYQRSGRPARLGAALECPPGALFLYF